MTTPVFFGFFCEISVFFFFESIHLSPEGSLTVGYENAGEYKLIAIQLYMLLTVAG